METTSLQPARKWTDIPDDEIVYTVSWTAGDISERLDQLGADVSLLDEVIRNVKIDFEQDVLLNGWGWQIVDAAIEDAQNKEEVA